MCRGRDTSSPSTQQMHGKFRFSLHAMLVAVAALSVAIHVIPVFGGLLYDLYIRDFTAPDFRQVTGLSKWFALTPELRVRLGIATVALVSIILWSLTPRIAAAGESRNGNLLLFTIFLAVTMVIATVALVLPGRILETSGTDIGFEIAVYSFSALLAFLLSTVCHKALQYFYRTLIRATRRPTRAFNLFKRGGGIEQRVYRLRIPLLLVPFSLALVVWWTSFPSRTWRTFVNYVEQGNFEAAESLLADDQLIKLVFGRRGRSPFWTIYRVDGTQVCGFNATSKPYQFKVSDLARRTTVDLFLARNRAFEFTTTYKNRKFGYFEVRRGEIYFIPRPQNEVKTPTS